MDDYTEQKVNEALFDHRDEEEEVVEEEKPAEKPVEEEKPADEKPEEKENLPTQHEDNAFTPNPALMASLYPQQMAQSAQPVHAAASEHLEAIGEEAEPLDTSPNQSCDSFSQHINDMMPAADDDLDVEALLGLPPMPEPPTSSSGLPEPPTSSSGLPEPLTNSSSLPEPLTNSSGLPEPLTNSSGLPEAPATDVAALNQTVAHSEKDLESLDFAAMTKEEKGYYLNMLLTKAMGRINAIPVGC